ncbi:TrmH family RNA methyltransferase [Pedobacter sp. UYP30]|uniref:TrmH family RNA methyltransferase n=1 Tax=Pedobacter sp. UYP30 TaxID=1756400 RepID=UPI0033909BBF
MLSKSQISFVKSLHQKKYRKENGLFFVEGQKSVQSFINSSYKVQAIYHVAEKSAFISQLPANINLFELNNVELGKISALQNPQDLLALVKIPETKVASYTQFKNNFTLVLDGVQDPGNLGTIIRTADWFGIKNIVCSHNTVEAYNPKTVQATMGSLAATNIYYTNLPRFLNEVALPIFGALLEGKSIYKTNFGTEGLIVLGNEGNGISAEIIAQIANRVTIPRIGDAESLNVAISAAIFCAEIARKG